METTGCMVELMPGLMPGPICVKLSGVAGVWWESDLGQKINFFINLEIFSIFLKEYFFCTSDLTLTDL